MLRQKSSTIHRTGQIDLWDKPSTTLCFLRYTLNKANLTSDINDFFSLVPTLTTTSDSDTCTIEIARDKYFIIKLIWYLILIILYHVVSFGTNVEETVANNV